MGLLHKLRHFRHDFSYKLVRVVRFAGEILDT